MELQQIADNTTTNNNTAQPDTGNTIFLNGKAYFIKKKMTVRQVRDAQKYTKDYISLKSNLDKAKTEEERTNVAMQLANVTEPQQQLIANVMETCLGLTQEQLDSLEFIDAALIYNELFEKSTTIAKK